MPAGATCDGLTAQVNVGPRFGQYGEKQIRFIVVANFQCAYGKKLQCNAHVYGLWLVWRQGGGSRQVRQCMDPPLTITKSSEEKKTYKIAIKTMLQNGIVAYRNQYHNEYKSIR